MATFFPQTLLDNLQLIISLSHATLLADSHIDFDEELLCKSSPSATTLKELLVCSAMDAIFETSDKIKKGRCKVS